MKCAMNASLALTPSLSSRTTVISAAFTSFRSGRFAMTLPTPSLRVECARQFSTLGRWRCNADKKDSPFDGVFDGFQQLREAQKIIETALFSELQKKLEERLSELDVKIKDLEKETEKLRINAILDSSMWGSEFLSNVATQILLFTIGDQPKDEKNLSSTGFENMLMKPEADKAGKRRLERLHEVSSLLDKFDLEIAKIMDKVISTRNSIIHCRTKAELASVVQDSIEYIERYPNIYEKVSDAIFILKNYEVLETLF